MKFAFRNVWRNKKVSIFAALVVAASTLFLMIFAGNIATYQSQLDQSYQIMKASAHITGESATATPQLTETQYGMLLDSGFIKEHSVMADHAINEQDILRGINKSSIDTTLHSCIQDVAWAEGYESDVFLGDAMVCVVPANRRMELGCVWTCTINQQKYEFVVVGIYGSKYTSKSNGAIFYCPVNALKNAYNNAGKEFTYCGMKMDLQNLQEIDLFKEQMKAAGMSEGQCRLVINDAQLRSVTAQLKRHVRVLESMLPILLALIAAIGFGISFLLLRSRKKEIAILRTIGMKRFPVFVSYLLETAMQAVLGMAVGILIGRELFDILAVDFQQLMIMVVYYLAGGGVAIWKLSGINIFTIMNVRE